MKWDDWISRCGRWRVHSLVWRRDMALNMLITFMIIDYLSGLAVAFSGHSKKLLMAGLIVV